MIPPLNITGLSLSHLGFPLPNLIPTPSAMIYLPPSLAENQVLAMETAPIILMETTLHTLALLGMIRIHLLMGKSKPKDMYLEPIKTVLNSATI
jgi:hypothetical protein